MSIQLRPLKDEQLSEEVIKAVGHSAPEQARMLAARGLVPLDPVDLISAIYQLTFDSDEGIASTARTQAAKLPDVILAPALAAAVSPMVLDFYARIVLDKKGPLQAVLLNSKTADDTILDLSGKLQEEEIEILARNQLRLLRKPEIIEQIYFNPRARMSTVQRLQELAARRGIDLKRIPHFRQMMEDIFGESAGEPLPEEPAAPPPPQQQQPAQPPSADQPVQPMQMPAEHGASPDAELDAALGVDGDLDAGMGDMDFGGDDFLDSAFSDALVGEDWEEDAFDGLDDLSAADEEEALNKLSTLPVNAKIRLATLGSSMHRAILIKDSNRLVALAAISSPAVSDTEASRFAANRSLSEDVIRYICQKREWHKNYTVKVSLAFNPKAPLAFTMRLINHLRISDLKQLAMSRNIPSALTQQAKRLVKKRSGN